MKTHTLHIQGMHCNACILLTESELEEVSYITKAKSSLNNHTVEITGEFDDKSPETIAEELHVFRSTSVYFMIVFLSSHVPASSYLVTQ
jgi:copper chaperone CopZ